MAYAFDGFRRQADATKVAPGTTLQWEFSDYEPWHVVLDPAGSSAAPGRAGSPDVTLRTSFDDWADVVAGRADPLRQILRRRLRVRGDWRAIAAMPRLMG